MRTIFSLCFNIYILIPVYISNLFISNPSNFSFILLIIFVPSFLNFVSFSSCSFISFIFSLIFSFSWFYLFHLFCFQAVQIPLFFQFSLLDFLLGLKFLCVEKNCFFFIILRILRFVINKFISWLHQNCPFTTTHLVGMQNFLKN